MGETRHHVNVTPFWPLPTMTVTRSKLEEWLARCQWLATTKLDDHTRTRVERLIIDLQQDLDEDERERRSQRALG